MKGAYSIIIVLLTILFILTLQVWRSHKNATNLNGKILNDTVTYYTNNLNTQTATIHTLQLNNQQLKKNIFRKNEKLKTLSKEFFKIKSIVDYKAILLIDTIVIPFKDTVQYSFERSGHIKKDWYSFKYTTDNKGFKIDSLAIPTQVTVITGVKRKWLLGRQIITTDITNTNPFIISKNIQSLEITAPVSWYKKWYLWLAGGIAGGIIFSQ